MALGEFRSKPSTSDLADASTNAKEFWDDMERMREYINTLERELKALEIKHNLLDARAKAKGI